MKKTKLLSLILAITATFSLTLGISAFATEGDTADGDAPVSSAADDAQTAEPEDGASAPEDTTDGKTTDEPEKQPISVAEIDSKLSNYSLKNPAVKFSLPTGFECVTLTSSSDDISIFGVSKSDFISYGYIAYGVNEASSSYYYLTRTQDEYTKHIKDYKNLSKDELKELASEMSGTIDQNTQTPAYDSAVAVKINGRNFIKTVASNATATTEVTVVEYTTLIDGYSYKVAYIYPKSLSEASVKNFTDTINNVKFGFSFNSATICSYAALVLGVISLLISIILFTKVSKLPANNVLSDSPDNDENYYGFDDNDSEESDTETDSAENTEEQPENPEGNSTEE